MFKLKKKKIPTRGKLKREKIRKNSSRLFFISSFLLFSFFFFNLSLKWPGLVLFGLRMTGSRYVYINEKMFIECLLWLSDNRRHICVFVCFKEEVNYVHQSIWSNARWKFIKFLTLTSLSLSREAFILFSVSVSL